MKEPPASTPTPIRTPPAGEDWLAQTEEAPPPPPPPKPKLKKLRTAFVLFGLGVIAAISTLFGMLMAVASDLPALENQAQFEKAQNSTLLPFKGDEAIAKLTGNQNRILLGPDKISANIKNAVIAIEDRRFYEHKGVDYKGIARAFWQDVLKRRAAQGGSTITQQFVKNALSAQGNRSVFQKLREAAVAYHMERRWPKQKILTQYLNSVYFGNGAYGIEAAMRTYFGEGDDVIDDTAATPQCPPDCSAQHASPEQAALLAGMIASPSQYDPVQNPARAKQRRNLVLRRMLDQGSITREQYEVARIIKVPTEDQVDPPRPESSQPYFSSWLTQQLVDRYRAGRVFGGGLRIRTTLDPELQAAAQSAITRRLGAIGPSASLVAIENRTGAVKAMVGGSSFDERPFNLATNGHRQPGSAFKPFTLIAALNKGISPDATFASQKKIFDVPESRGEKFVVNNYEDQYLGLASLRSATATSDNSVYAELGIKVGTRRISRLARRMGIRTPVSTNPAMTLGGLKEGVTPLEMAYAYSTIANKGRRVSGTLAPNGRGPVAVRSVKGPAGSGFEETNKKREKRVFSEEVGETAHQLLAGVISSGTGRAAQIGEFAAGKTGTTENYGDAWFVGFNNELTVAVWVGYADKLQPMETEYHGNEVAGGTYPAEIWHDFMTSWIEIREQQEAASGKDKDEPPAPITPTPLPVPPAEAAAPAGTPPPEEDEGGAVPEAEQDEGGAVPEQPQSPPPDQAPQPEPAPAPAPEPQPAPGDGGGTGPGGTGAPG